MIETAAVDDNPLNDPIVIVAIIGFIQAVTLLLLGYVISKLGKVNRNTAATAEQIVNHHPQQPNFREENDKRHEETRRWFRYVAHQVRDVEKSVNKRIDDLAEDVGDLLTGWFENRERIEDIEDTMEMRKGIRNEQ